MQGIFINGVRPTSKKQVREALAANPASVRFEATSWHGNEYDGPASEATVSKVAFVGPDPERKRNFYGTAIRSLTGEWKVT